MRRPSATLTATHEDDGTSPNVDHMDKHPINIQHSDLDFSEFHPLDHTIFARCCTEFYGGRRTHLEYWWDFKGHSALRRMTTCKLGHHKMTEAHQRDPKNDEWTTRQVCLHCWAPERT